MVITCAIVNLITPLMIPPFPKKGTLVYGTNEITGKLYIARDLPHTHTIRMYTVIIQV